MWSSNILICALMLAWVQAQEEVEINVPQGALKGEKLDTLLYKKPYYSFKGIPYAKPILGDNRFQAPEPAGPWDGVWDATDSPPFCPFYCVFVKQFVGDEDCLYLNVYTPDLDPNAGKAVIVFIHGVGWQAGTGNDILYGPDFLMEQDIVLVTFNYRLGPNGFLNTGDANAPGNMGMKDQVMVLRWVKDNIRYFGGCPNKITILGQDSGSASVQYHMISPMSQGLFNRAIQQSGSVLNPWAFTARSRELAFQLGEMLGIQTTDTAELVKKLKEVPMQDLIETGVQLQMKLNTFGGEIYGFVPAVEADVGQERFLESNPWDIVENGKVADVPVMTGVMTQESVFSATMLQEHALKTNDHFEVFVPVDLNVTDVAQKKQIADMLKKFYFKDKPLTMETFNDFRTLLDDSYFVGGADMFLRILGARNSAPIYEYLFTFEGPVGFLKNMIDIEEGVVHCDELAYQFYGGFFDNLPKIGSHEEKMTRIMTKLLANFARDEDPTSKLDEDVTTKWIPKGKDNNYMNINLELKMEKDFFPERKQFWRELYKDNLGKYA